MKNTVESLKGEYVTRRLNGKSIWQILGWCRFNRKYELQNFNDANQYMYLKKGTIVHVAENF